MYGSCVKDADPARLGLLTSIGPYADTVGIRLLRILVCAKKTVAHRDYRTLDVSHAAVLERDIIDAVIDPCGVCYDINREITNQDENECQ